MCVCVSVCVCSRRKTSTPIRFCVRRAQVAEYKNVFEMFDTDGSGEISSEELTKILEQLGMCPSAEDIHKIPAIHIFDSLPS